MEPIIDLLPIAVRAFPELEPDSDEEENEKQDLRSGRKTRFPRGMLVVDTESRTDATQRLTFGGYRWLWDGQNMEEGLFYGDDLPHEDLAILKEYVRTNDADVVFEGNPRLQLLTRNEFAEKIIRDAFRDRCLLVAFNFPFDISRIALDCTDARRSFLGGFSLSLCSDVDDSGQEIKNQYIPSVTIKQIDNKRALKSFTAPFNPDKADLIPEGSPSGQPEKGYIFRGHILDLRTLAYVLTDRGHSLESACEAFGVEHSKEKVSIHGIVTPEYIRYNRRDVLATAELAQKLLEEYGKNPIGDILPPTKAYSSASVGKAYLQKMGITPILQRLPDFPKRYLGYAQTAFFGGRTSAHIRKTPVPVIYTDFLSMYPTVNSLMDLWRFVIAERITVVEHCADEIDVFLKDVNAPRLFKQDTWRQLTAFVQVIPEGDILPNRSQYNPDTKDWQVGLNYLYAGERDPSQSALWFSLPDVVASVLLTGRIPKIVDAFRLEAHGVLSGLNPVKLRNAIEVDPSKQDFFRVVIEERNRLKRRTDLPKMEKDRLDKSLKVTANGTSYGIYAEMNRLESELKKLVTCFGVDSTPFICSVSHPDRPGTYNFSPIASLITGAARLMLALLEHRVTELGGTYAMEDTDSMAIVTTETGGLVPVPGGTRKTEDGRDAVIALSRQQVENIRDEFAALNPYDEEAVNESILKIEGDNFDPINTKKPRQIYCVAISAKRYALFLLDDKGEPSLLRSSCQSCGRKNKPGVAQCEKCNKPVSVNNGDDRWSEHGLGHLLNPTDPENEDREWIAQIWLNIVRKQLNLPTKKVKFERVPAISRTTISTPKKLEAFEGFNEGKPYVDKIKPSNFLLSCHIAPFGYPLDADPEQFHLIAQYDSDPREWLNRKWIDQYSGKEYSVSTNGPDRDENTARVETYGGVILKYEFHAESKCAGSDGQTCGRQTVGLLQRRHVRITQIKYIGKESNSLEEVVGALVHSAQNVYTEYTDPRRDEWETVIRPLLLQLKLEDLEQIPLSKRTLLYARSGKKRPHLKNQACIVEFFKVRKMI